MDYLNNITEFQIKQESVLKEIDILDRKIENCLSRCYEISNEVMINELMQDIAYYKEKVISLKNQLRDYETHELVI